MLIGHMPTTRAKSPIIEHQKNAKYPEMRRNGMVNGCVKINRITLYGTAQVIIRNVDSPSCIWVELTNNITHELTVTEPFDLKKANFDGAAPREMVDNYYMVPREERTYSRARVLAAVEIEDAVFVQVIFIDHGDVVWVNVECLAELPKNFEYHPWQVICLSLTDLEKVHDGNVKEIPANYWTKEDCELFADLISEYAEYNIRVLKGSVIRNDYREPLKVEMYGVDPVEQGVMLATYKKKPKGRNIACIFAGRSKGKVRYIEVDDASKYPIIIGASPSKSLDPEEASEIPLFRRTFPENWIHKEESDQPFAIPRSEWDQWSINDVKVPYITTDYVHKNFYDELSASYLVFIEGTCTQSPYEFYGRFFKRIHKEFTKEEKEAFEPFVEVGGATLEEQQQLGDITCSMLKSDADLKEYARILDTFYGIADNRFMLDPDEMKRWLDMNTRVYAITNVPEERSMYTGEWQRVEVLAVDTFATVRYLDSGGSDTIAVSNLYRIHSRHASYHPLCAQFCLLGVSDPQEEASKTWDMKRRKGFSAALRVDVPLMISVLHHPNLLRKRDRADKPFERDNVLFVEGARIMGESKTLLETLFEQGCKNNPTQPIVI